MGLFNALGNNNNVQNQGYQGAAQGQNQGMNIAQMYKNFKAALSGDPYEILRQGVASGKYRPEIVDQAKQILGMK